MRVEGYAELDDLPGDLPAAWNGLLAPDSVTRGVDATATYEWHAALREAFLDGRHARLLVAHHDDGRVAGVLPIHAVTTHDGRAVRGRIATWSELHCGRSGLVLDSQCDDVLQHLMSCVDREFPEWNCLEITLPDGNGDRERLERAIGERCVAIVPEPLERSPYIALPERFDDYFKTLRPGFRTEVGRGTRRLGELGAVERRLFTSDADVEPLWEAICTIERQSWKEREGTSITTNPSQARFYESLLPRAASAGQLLSTVLYLDDRAIAHQLCVRSGAVAAILKMSYVEDLRRHYPATVLLASYLRDLFEQGLRYLDFMGVCDDFKMRWTDLTYGRTRYLLYRNSLGGRFAYWRKLAAQSAATRIRARACAAN